MMPGRPVGAMGSDLGAVGFEVEDLVLFIELLS